MATSSFITAGGVPMTRVNGTVDTFRANNAGMVDMQRIINDALQRAMTQGHANTQLAKDGKMSLSEYDLNMSQLLAVELERTVTALRKKAVSNAQAAGAGSASTAVLRRVYKGGHGANINILNSRKRLSNRMRVYKEGEQRTVSKRTQALNSYYGPDRGFILRFLDGGTDVRTVEPAGPTGPGSRASWGRRGSIAPRDFFHSMGSDMEEAAQELGTTIVGHVEHFIEKKFIETKQ